MAFCAAVGMSISISRLRMGVLNCLRDFFIDVRWLWLFFLFRRRMGAVTLASVGLMTLMISLADLLTSRRSYALSLVRIAWLMVV